ncbi:MAG: AfsR/SARP family transcriptional regulator, partial [Acidimicrobiales bacterium]
MEFLVLGSLEVRDEDRAVDVGPRMQRALLAVLLRDPGTAISLDRLTDALWGDSPPGAPHSALHVYVSNLRRVLEPGRPARAQPTVLVRQPPGYCLRVEPGSIDAGRFVALVAAGRGRLVAGDPAGAAAALEAALGLWRGSPYADLSSEPFLQGEIARLGELRAGALETLADAQLELGAHAAIIADLEQMAAEEPLRERRWELLALALYRSGRQTESLRVLRQARDSLVEELGIEPGAALRRLEQDILQHAPTLDWHPAADPALRAAAPSPAAAARPA